MHTHALASDSLSIRRIFWVSFKCKQRISILIAVSLFGFHLPLRFNLENSSEKFVVIANNLFRWLLRIFNQIFVSMVRKFFLLLRTYSMSSIEIIHKKNVLALLCYWASLSSSFFLPQSVENAYQMLIDVHFDCSE